MVERVRLNKPNVTRSDDVGYCKPPKRTQFKPGQSGYPKGRPKGVRNFSTDVLSTLQSPIKVNKGGRTRNISTQLATLLVLRDKALKGDLKAADHLIDLAARYNTGQQSPATRELDADDQAILAAYGRELLTEDASTGRTDSAKMSTKVNRQ
jgi:Family of unknown function (DUF5681)